MRYVWDWTAPPGQELKLREEWEKEQEKRRRREEEERKRALEWKPIPRAAPPEEPPAEERLRPTAERMAQRLLEERRRTAEQRRIQPTLETPTVPGKPPKELPTPWAPTEPLVNVEALKTALRTVGRFIPKPELPEMPVTPTQLAAVAHLAQQAFLRPTGMPEEKIVEAVRVAQMPELARQALAPSIQHRFAELPKIPMGRETIPETVAIVAGTIAGQVPWYMTAAKVSAPIVSAMTAKYSLAPVAQQAIHNLLTRFVVASVQADIEGKPLQEALPENVRSAVTFAVGVTALQQAIDAVKMSIAPHVSQLARAAAHRIAPGQVSTVPHTPANIAKLQQAGFVQDPATGSFILRDPANPLGPPLRVVETTMLQKVPPMTVTQLQPTAAGVQPVTTTLPGRAEVLPMRVVVGRAAERAVARKIPYAPGKAPVMRAEAPKGYKEIALGVYAKYDKAGKITDIRVEVVKGPTQAGKPLHEVLGKEVELAPGQTLRTELVKPSPTELTPLGKKLQEHYLKRLAAEGWKELQPNIGIWAKTDAAGKVTNLRFEYIVGTGKGVLRPGFLSAEGRKSFQNVLKGFLPKGTPTEVKPALVRDVEAWFMPRAAVVEYSKTRPDLDMDFVEKGWKLFEDIASTKPPAAVVNAHLKDTAVREAFGNVIGVPLRADTEPGLLEAVVSAVRQALGIAEKEPAKALEEALAAKLPDVIYRKDTGEELKVLDHFNRAPESKHGKYELIQTEPYKIWQGKNNRDQIETIEEGYMVRDIKGGEYFIRADKVSIEPVVKPKAETPTVKAPAAKELEIRNNQVRTVSGRMIPAPPIIRVESDRKAVLDLKAAEKWLLENARAEASAKADEYNLLLMQEMVADKLTTADKDFLNMYLFGDTNPVFQKVDAEVSAKSIPSYEHERRLLLAERKEELIKAVREANEAVRRAEKEGKPRVLAAKKRNLEQKEKQLEAVVAGRFTDEDSARSIIAQRLREKYGDTPQVRAEIEKAMAAPEVTVAEKPTPAEPHKTILSIPQAKDDRFKSWAKALTGIDPEAKGGYIYQGDWLKRGHKAELPVGTKVLLYDETGSRASHFPDVSLMEVTAEGLRPVSDAKGPIETSGSNWALDLRDRVAAAMGQDMVREDRVVAQIPLIGDSRFKRWAKIVSDVDKSKTRGDAFLGEFVGQGKKVDLPIGSHVLIYGREGSRARNVPVVTVMRLKEDGTWESVLHAEGEDWALTIRDRLAEMLPAVPATAEATTEAVVESEKATPAPLADLGLIRRGVEKALEEIPARITHGYTRLHSFIVGTDGNIYKTDEHYEDLKKSRVGLAVVHSHLPDNWKEFPDKVWGSFNSDDVYAFRKMAMDLGIKHMAIIRTQNKMDILSRTQKTPVDFYTLGRAFLRKIIPLDDVEAIRDFADDYKLGYAELVSFEPPKEVIAPEPTNLEDQLDALRDVLKAKKPNAASGEAILKKIELLGVDVTGARDLLDEYRNIVREDYEDTEEYQDEKHEAWEAFLEAVDDLEVDEEMARAIVESEEVPEGVHEPERVEVESSAAVGRHGEPALEGAPPEDVQGTEEVGRSAEGAVRRPGAHEERVRLPGERETSTAASGVGASEGELDTASGREERAGAGERPEAVGAPTDRGGRPGSRAGGRNYRITDADRIGEGGPKAKYRDNVAAIRLMKNIESEQRPATPEEQAVLVRYVGWGGIWQAFDVLQKDWRAEYEELRELLTEEEWVTARNSTPNAHYTSPEVIKAMWDIVRHLGFNGGRILEPSLGVGHFIGYLPEELAGKARFTGIELDDITGRIARLIYPESDVRIQGFEVANLPDNFFDLAISNVPFGDYGVHDPRYERQGLTAPIHNYFFVKALDKVRPGGLIAFITSRFTMDSTKHRRFREYINQHADFLGAVRLPNTAFKGIARTEVTTDIIFLKKRLPDEVGKSEPWLEVKEMTTEKGETASVNEYYVENPQMVLGTLALSGKMYRRGELTVESDGRDLGEALAIAMDQLPANVMAEWVHKAIQDVPAEQFVPAPDHVKPDAFAVIDGKLMKNADGEMVPVELSGKVEARVRDAIELRSVMRELLRLELTGAADEEVKTKRKELNQVYDAFVKKHGYISSRANNRVLGLDPDYYFLAALERYDEKTKTYHKAPIFQKRVIRHYEPVTHVESSQDALVASLAEHGRLDLDYMGAITGFSQERLISDLKGLMYHDPEQGVWVTADEYLSGNVRAKLRAAEGAAEHDPAYQENIDALKKVQPKDLGPGEIRVQLGAPWIPNSDVHEFVARHIFNLYGWNADKVKIEFRPETGEWRMDGSQVVRNKVENTTTWGTQRCPAWKLIDDALNMRRPKVYDLVYDEEQNRDVRVFNPVETAAAQEKQEKIRDEFKKWVWADEERRERLVRKYNDEYNNLRLRTFDGNHLKLPGANPVIFDMLWKHQRNAIWRIMQQGNCLLAHVVGAGKTWTMVASAMELKRLGVTKKPMFVVPDHLVEQCAKDFLALYPAANILVPTKKDFSTKNRRRLMAKIVTGDWDAVIVSHTSFKIALPMSENYTREFFKEQLDELEHAMDLERAKGTRHDKGYVKRLAAARNRLETKIEKQLGRLKRLRDRGGYVEFEELGVDALYVDEAHEFKNLFYYTKMGRVGGLGSQNGSLKAFDLYMKVRYLQKLNGGRGVVFATGTPIANSIAELFAMQRYLTPEVLEELGIHNFDAWIGSFAEVVSGLELKPEGKGFQQKERLARFVNMPELIRLFRNFADVQTAEDLRLPVPKLVGGKRTVVTAPRSEELKLYINSLAERAERVRAGEVEPREDNMLKITTDGRHAAVDVRLRLPDAPDHPESKVNLCVRDVFETWQKTKKDKLTQIVFLDLSTPKAHKPKADEDAPDEDVDEEPTLVETTVYNDFKAKLVARGVPEKEIAFIHDAKDDAAKMKLFNAMNEGRVRVLIGSTGKMGVGMNVQQRLVAIRHLDAPWRPCDIEQREGRILRPGNLNDEVEIAVYLTQGSFDSYMWETIERKARFIWDIMRGGTDVREVEDVGPLFMEAAEIKACAVDDPRIREIAQIETQLRKLDALKQAHEDEQTAIQVELVSLPKQIQSAEERIAKIKKDIAMREDIAGNKFRMVVMKKQYTERVKAGEALLAAMMALRSRYGKALKEDRNPTVEDTMQDVGSLAGFNLAVEIPSRLAYRLGRVAVDLQSPATYERTSREFNLDTVTPFGLVRSLEETLLGLEKRIDELQKKIEDAKQSLKRYEEQAGKPFEYADLYAQLTERVQELRQEMDLGAKDVSLGDEISVPEDEFIAAFEFKQGSPVMTRHRPVAPGLMIVQEPRTSENEAPGWYIVHTPSKRWHGPYPKAQALAAAQQLARLTDWNRPYEDVMKDLSQEDINHALQEGIAQAQASMQDEDVRRRADEALENIAEPTEEALADPAYAPERTSVKQVAAGLRKAVQHRIWPRGSVIVDVGGGRFTLGVDYLKNYGIESHVYDPYALSKAHNHAVLEVLNSRGGADGAACCNVLNVIPDEEDRRAVLQFMYSLMRPGAKAVITVYEGDKSGVGKRVVQQQQYWWQANRMLADYEDEIKAALPDADIEKQYGMFVVKKAVEPGEEAMAVEVAGKAPENLSEVKFEYVPDMPPEIELPNPEYAIDLFEATRLLGTQARYERLQKGLMGIFKKEEEKIDLRSVKSIPSIAHELGHAIDWRMNDNSYPRSIKGRFPGAKEEERDLRAELLRASQVMRPVAGGPDAFSAYRRRHTEIMADFYSMYVLDPDLAHEYAPTVARLFEERLRQKPSVAKVIAELLEARRKVPGEPEPDALAEVVRAQIEKLRPIKRLDLVVPKEIEAYPEKVKWLVKMWSRLQILKVMEAGKKAQAWQKELTEEQREDIGAAIEGVGNFRTGRSYEQIMETMTPRQKEIMKEARYVQEVSREEVNKFLVASGQREAIAFLEDYIFHIYTGPKKRKQEFITRWLKRSPSELPRKFLTYDDAIKAGLTPITQDIAYLYKMWSGVNWRMAINRSFIAELGHLRNEDGLPVIQKPKNAPGHWIRVDHPAIRQVYARRGEKGELYLWEGGAMVDPEAWKFLRQVFEQPINHPVIKFIEAFNAYAKKISLTLSMFHPWSLTESIVASIGRPWNLARGLVQFVKTGKGIKVARPHLLGLAALEHEEFLQDCIASGLTVDPIPDVQVSRVQKGLRELEARTRKIFGVNYFTQALLRGNEWWDNWLWHRYYTGMKAQTWNELVLEALNQAPEDMSEQDIRNLKEKLAHLVNDQFGGQEWVTHWWASPITRQLLQMMFLAPDYTYTCIRIAARIFTSGGDPMLRKFVWRYWFNMILAYLTFANLTNYALNKRWTWQNEPGHKIDIDVTPIMHQLPWVDKEDPRRYYIRPGKQWREVLRYWEDLSRTLGAKMSPIVQTLMEQFAGASPSGWEMPWSRQDMGFYESIPERLKAVYEKFIPFGLRGNNFAFTFPISRGMGWWQAQRTYEDLMRAEVDPKWWKRNYQRDLLRKNYDALKKEIDDAAVLNGLDPIDLWRQANTNLRTHYYGRLWKAVNDGNVKEAEKAAKVLVELGATLQTAGTSARWYQEEAPYERRISEEVAIKGLAKFARKEIERRIKEPLKPTLYEKHEVEKARAQIAAEAEALKEALKRAAGQ